MGRLSEDLSEERGTGLKKNIILTGGFFIMKTVYIGIWVISGKNHPHFTSKIN